MADERPLRLCDSCGQVDRDPRHVHAFGPDETLPAREDVRAKVEALSDELSRVVGLQYLADEGASIKHLDCCLADGCPDGSCDRRLEDDADPFDGGKTTGDALVRKLDKHVKALTAAAQDQEA